MNTNLIIAHKSCFDWWLLNQSKGCRVKHSNRWHVDLDPFSNPNPNITIQAMVINDPFAKYRKAEVDGETIQCKQVLSNGHQWLSANTKNFCGLPSDYRIKPPGKWQDNISPSHPVNCRVKDSSGDQNHCEFICDYDPDNSHPYGDVYGARWLIATPIMASELHPFQRENYYTNVEYDRLRTEWNDGPANNPPFLRWLSEKELK